jgi:hypothetical protein
MSQPLRSLVYSSTQKPNRGLMFVTYHDQHWVVGLCEVEARVAGDSAKETR